MSGRWKGLVVRALGALVALTACASAPRAHADAFYDATPGELRGRPGTVIRAEPLAATFGGATAFKVLYRSTGLRGEPIAVSGVIVVPDGPAPEGGRPVVAWAHPTTGVARHCAPSLQAQVLHWIPGLAHMIARGYAVAATDYPGLGTHGPHPYMIGASEARAVLDSVRAARALPEAQAGNRFAVWGHSQGGQAALFAGELARSYAPELRLAGVAAAAPATELAELFHTDLRSPAGMVLGTFALWAWSKAYDLSLDGVIAPTAPLVLDRIAGICNDDQQDLGRLAFAIQPLLREGFLITDVTKADPWRKLMTENTPGKMPPGLPVFLAQGTADAVVRPQVTEQYLRMLCAAGTPVRFVPVPGGDHAASAKRGADAAVEWIAERFAGEPAPSDC